MKGTMEYGEGSDDYFDYGTSQSGLRLDFALGETTTCYDIVTILNLFSLYNARRRRQYAFCFSNDNDDEYFMTFRVVNFSKALVRDITSFFFHVLHINTLARYLVTVSV